MHESTSTEALGICAESTGVQGARFRGIVAREMMARQRAASSRSALVSPPKWRCMALTIGLYSVNPRQVISIDSALHSLSTRSCEVDVLVSSERDAMRGSNSHEMRRGSRCAAMHLHNITKSIYEYMNVRTHVIYIYIYIYVEKHANVALPELSIQWYMPNK
jgi:hypothetical protein